MTRYRLTLAYDGTDFSGWQIQAEETGARTVQRVLEAALTKLARGAAVRVTGSGRTDTGVHALGQIVSFELPQVLEPALLLRALNSLLPADVRVCAAGLAPAGFCARRSARGKHYRYVLDSGPFQLPERRRVAAHVPLPLNEDTVRAASEIFLGTQDFASLASAGGSVETTVRTITRSLARFEDLALVPAGRTLTYDVEGSGFLRKMVRSIVGGLIAAGRGTATPETLRRALAAHDRRAWPAPAPARGLTLVRVDCDETGA